MAEDIGAMVIETAESMKGEPAGQADFFASLQEKLETDERARAFGHFTLENDTPRRAAATRRFAVAKAAQGGVERVEGPEGVPEGVP